MKEVVFDRKIGLVYELKGDYYYVVSSCNIKEEYGKYGKLAEKYLEKYRTKTYNLLLRTRKFDEYLINLDREAREMERNIIEKMAKANGVDENLKQKDMLKWVCLMNNFKKSAEEIVLKELVYAR